MMGTTYLPGDTSEIRSDIGDLVIQFGSLTKAAANMRGISLKTLSLVMRQEIAPTPLLLDYLEYDRIYRVEYLRK
jgi:hypothetical protein